MNIANALMSTTAAIDPSLMSGHTFPYGLKSKALIEGEGYVVDDHCLTTQDKTDAFKAERARRTTPQVQIDGRRKGGYDDTALLRQGRPRPERRLLSPGDRDLRDDRTDGGRHQLGRVRRRSRHARSNGSSRSARRAGDHEAAAGRAVLDEVPRPRPAGATLGAARLRVSVRGGLRRHPDDRVGRDRLLAPIAFVTGGIGVVPVFKAVI